MKSTIVMSIIAFSMSLSSCGVFQKGGKKMDKTETSSSEVITGKKWKLIELNGKPVADKVNGKEPFLELDASEKRYSASGGCNGIGGNFTLSANNRISFAQGMSTMMACPDMTIEQGLSRVFTTVDNYTVKDGILSLNKARMAPLAKFQEVKEGSSSKEQALIFQDPALHLTVCIQIKNLLSHLIQRTKKQMVTAVATTTIPVLK